MVALNNLYYLRPCNPFGGYKKSGFGKNNSKFAFEELCNIKIVTYEKQIIIIKRSYIIIGAEIRMASKEEFDIIKYDTHIQGG